ncbi:DNA repair protein RadC [Aliifodinibius sp. S!AR15-10]|uniref:RadC family protein n=1 Tax=Aliifodinibius sp. S!AR15-10 TaxID=2950437 RepID=UPI00285746B2|nr:DNA repair protein RadC [Aliifodinibius sp. S!AR15-10]MDR8393723.1 DNA repair protein RadC [Aliifodinibius sp. S!AR15-10]
MSKPTESGEEEKETFEADKFRNRTVKEMRPDEQPREKLMKYGGESLSDAELLAILLRTGSREMNVIQMSQAVLDHFDGLRHLARKGWQDLKVIPGMGKVKSLTLEAVFELSRRIQVASLGDQLQITSPQEAVAYFGPKLRDLTKEVFLVAFLNNAKYLMGYHKISSGGSTATIVDPAEIMRQSVLNEAQSILLLHNHPSGNKDESKADIQLTNRVVKAGKLLGIPVNDHIIIAGDSYTSFRAKGLIE